MSTMKILNVPCLVLDEIFYFDVPIIYNRGAWGVSMAFTVNIDTKEFTLLENEFVVAHIPLAMLMTNKEKTFSSDVACNIVRRLGTEVGEDLVTEEDLVNVRDKINSILDEFDAR